MPTFWFNADGEVLVDGSGSPYDCADCPCCPCCDFDSANITLSWTGGPPLGSIGNPYWTYAGKLSGICTWTASVPIEDSPDYTGAAVLEWHCDNDGEGNPGWRARCTVYDQNNGCDWVMDEISVTIESEDPCGTGISYSGSHNWTGSGGACSNYSGSTVTLSASLNP